MFISFRGIIPISRILLNNIIKIIIRYLMNIVSDLRKYHQTTQGYSFSMF